MTIQHSHAHANPKSPLKRSFSRLYILMVAAALSVAMILSAPAQAAGPAFNELTQGDFDNAIRELSGNATYHSVTGASSLGALFGVEVGLVAGLTSTPEIDKLSKQADPNASVSQLPHASLLAAVSVPMGFTIEALLFPSISVGEVKYQQFGGSVKWTSGDVLMLPFNLAARAFFTKNEMSFGQTLNNTSTGPVPVAVDVKQENSQYGLQILASPNLPFIEPYIGIGTVSAKGSLAVSGATTGTIFNFTSAQKAESSPTSTQFILGVNANLLLLNLGLEYNRVFSTDSYNFKLGFKF